MFKIKKIISAFLLIFLSMIYLFTRPAMAEDPQPQIQGEYGIAIDAVTGDILYSKNSDAEAYPASITKIMTAILLDEKVKDNQMLTVSANAAGQECVCFGLKAGELISKKDAMYGMLLISANDLAVTVAENIGGSVSGFAQLMNDEVKKLGLHYTHFVTPNGLHDPNHYTSAHDMALIMKEALKHPEVLKALSTQTVLVHTSLRDRTVNNTSRVHTQPKSSHVIAGKNGYTDQAQGTLVEYLKDGNKEVIAVVMKTPRKFEYHDIQTMANYAFAHMKTKAFASKGHVVEKATINGQKVNLIASNDLTVTLKSDEISKLTAKINLAKTAGKTIKKGQVVASFKVIRNGETLKEIPLVTDKKIMKTAPQKANGISGSDAIPFGILILAILFILLNMMKRSKRRNKMRSRRSR